MALSNEPLWRALGALQLDDPEADLTFTQRLARENGWPEKFAKEVVGEYKRFVYLCNVSTEELTPSDQVDQAWHLHLAYTDSYWIEMCGKILGKQLPHNPTKGGDNESKKFAAWYERTLRLYEQEFDRKPPRTAWPKSSIRFGKDLKAVRVHTSRYRVVHRSFGVVAGLVIAAAFIFAFAIETGESYEPALVIAGTMFATLMGQHVFSPAKLNDFSKSSGGGCGGGGCGGCGGCGG